MSFKFPTQPQRRNKPSVVENIVYQLQLAYYRYEVTFSSYVLTPVEKVILNTIVLSFFSLLLAIVYSCLPPLVTRALVRGPWSIAESKNCIVVQSNTTIWNEMPIVAAY
ncbi:hypothetical protein LSUE1_G007751 [Lachnellula suecica]|uniref:Uncharacterized protein n=1 Tax=Lachnellula suecica TaxID=602035 RepID=A0A8T9BVZ1_9HELO|nr:hypothetical protein LSUE1_G007751 [Lachnellula suecica]